MQTKRAGLLGAVSLFFCALIWGSTFVAQVFGAQTIGPHSYNAVRFLIGSLALLPLVCIRQRNKPFLGNSPARTLLGALVCGIVLFAGSYFQQRGMADTGAGKAGFISALYIVLVPILRSFSGSRAKLTAWLSVLVALLGMYLLCIHPVGSLVLGIGDLMVLISALFFSLHILSVDYFVRDTDPVLLSCIQFCVTGLAAAAFSAGEHTTLPDILACKWSILYAGLLSCGIAYTLQAVGQRHVEPLQASLLLSLESVFSAISGAIVLSERFTPRELVGCILIFTAVLFGECEETIRNIIQSRRRTQ